jgi:hypothetical protein
MTFFLNDLKKCGAKVFFNKQEAINEAVDRLSTQ